MARQTGSEAGHRYTFGGGTDKSTCKRCDSPDHWTMHCPTKAEEEQS